MINERLTKVLNYMKKSSLEQMIISDPAAIFYLTGKWIHPGERMLVLYINLSGNHRLFINELFPVNENLGIEKVWFSDIQDSIEILASYIGHGTIGIDKNWPARFLLKLMKLKSNCEYINGSFIIDKIRASKDLEERDLLRAASKLNDAGMKNLIEVLSNKLSEKKAAGLLSEIYEKLCADGHSFDPIIAYGPNAADPHHSPDNSMLKDGDSIIIDIGCIKNSYCADMTRTVFYKSVSDKSKEIYNIVLEANKLAIAAVKPGVRFCDIDAAARNYIEACGYGKYFTHRTGHSIGIEVHDFGDVSAINTDKLEAGMCFSIEPGIYLNGEVGVRIEDLVLVTEDGCEVLNKYDKSLKIIG
jgi:Xaa-Pro dipeptidase